MLTLIENGEVYAPRYAGVQDIVLAGAKILRRGEVDRRALLALDLSGQVIDATDCLVTPGFIDPHEHLIGAGGEEGFASRLPEVGIEEIVTAGITTAVGCLGTDTTTRHLTSLLAKVRQLDELGITAYMYTGAFPVPPPTITTSVTDDLVIIDKVIGVGGIAVSDRRSAEPSLHELARLASQAMVGGLIAGKAGVTHVHLGPGKGRLSLLHALLDEYDLPAECLYATHITRSPELMDEAIELARRGAYVDIDTTEEDLPRWLRYYRAHGGPPDHLTASSDTRTAGGAPAKLYAGFVASAREQIMPLEDLLALFTHNPATALKLAGKGQLETNMDGDILVIRKQTLEIVHVFARGQQIVKDGQVAVHDPAATP